MNYRRIEMKLNKTLVALTIGLLGLTSCDKTDDPLEPSGNYSPLRVDFPQGTNEWDSRIEQIYKTYGVYLIYKDVTPEDLNRTWVSVGTGDLYYGDDLPDEEVSFYVDFFEQQIFPYFSPEVVQKAFPIKIYMLKHLRAESRDVGGDGTGTGTGTGTIITEVLPSGFKAMKWDGFDYWAISFTESEIYASDDRSMKQKRCGIIYQIIANMVEDGTIVEPADLRDGVDLETALSVRKSDQNYRFNRGIPNSILTSFGVGTRTGAAELTSDYSGANSMISTYSGENNHEYFLNYIRNIMWFTATEFEEKYSAYPLIVEKYNLVANYMLVNCGLDLKAIAGE